MLMYKTIDRQLFTCIKSMNTKSPFIDFELTKKKGETNSIQLNQTGKGVCMERKFDQDPALKLV